jgi:regulator of RNase E activity RraA
VKQEGRQARIDGIRSASLADAMGRAHSHRSHISGLLSPTPERVLFGPAVTLLYVPVREDLRDASKHKFSALFYDCIAEGAAGKVLVLASCGHEETSMGGGVKLSRVENHKMAGVLTDGCLRDFSELASYEFATFCSGPTPRWGGDVVMPFMANVPVVIKGVTVVPGDYIYSDCDGAVVIPKDKIDSIISEALQIERADQLSIKRIKREHDRPNKLKSRKEASYEG